MEIPHPAWKWLHRSMTRAGESWQYDCLSCGRVFHTHGDNPQARCWPCRLLHRAINPSIN